MNKRPLRTLGGLWHRLFDIELVDWILGAGLPACRLLYCKVKQGMKLPNHLDIFRHAAQIISRVFPEPVG